ncbi:MAG: HAD-IA family hydrolase [Proteobacteria bacterium]|nr:HAD-IA family hydrolase [Pseudomonadota bacterium]
MTAGALPAVWVVDVDGVLVDADSSTWQHPVCAAAGITPQQLRAFFRAEWPDCVEGRRDTAQALAPWLECWGASCDAEAFIAAWHREDAELNRPLLARLAAWRVEGARLLLATNQDHRRADYLWTTLGLGTGFDGMVHSAAVGARKPGIAFWQAVADRIGPHEPEDVVVIDDNAENLAGAAPFEWRTHHFTGNAGFFARFAD